MDSRRWPHYDDEQIADVVRVLRSGRVNAWTGPEVVAFERAYADHVGRRHAIALANGTVALELALRCLGVGPGDEVIVTPRSFVASASSVVLAGARPVFADVDRDTQNLTPATIEQHLTARTKAVIVVHLAGWPADMPSIIELCRPRAVGVIEDCAQAHGATVGGRPAGGWGDIAAFSFCQDKIISTGGEGGLIVLDDDEAWRRAWSFKDHGKSYSAVFEREHPPGFRWLHETIGTNWRMSGLAAVLGLRQLERLPGWVEKRRANAALLIEAMAGMPGLRVPVPPAGVRHAYYRLYAFVRPERLRPDWSRDRIVNELERRAVPCFSGSCSEIYREKAFADAGLAPAAPLPVTRELGETSLAFLVDPQQDEASIRAVAAALAKVMQEATATRESCEGID